MKKRMTWVQGHREALNFIWGPQNGLEAKMLLNRIYMAFLFDSSSRR